MSSLVESDLFPVPDDVAEDQVTDTDSPPAPPDMSAFETRILRELRHIGLVPEASPVVHAVDPDEPEGDIKQEMIRLSRELEKVQRVNQSRNSRVLALAKKWMA